MMSQKWVFLNGSFLEEKDAFIPITDRGFLFGEGVFTSVRVNNGNCELLAAHFNRLEQQAEILGFHWTSLDVKNIAELIDRNRAYAGIWRLKIIGTVAEKDGNRAMGALLITVEPAENFAFNPCSLTVFPHPFVSPLAHVKSLNYLDHLSIRQYAKRQGYVDAITQTENGTLLETGCSNLFWFDKGKYWIPDTRLPYLKGVFLQSISPHFPRPIEMVNLRLEQLPPTAHVYICNALTHVRPVVAIDQRHFSRSKEVEYELKQIIESVVNRQTKVLNRF